MCRLQCVKQKQSQLLFLTWPLQNFISWALYPWSTKIHLFCLLLTQLTVTVWRGIVQNLHRNFSKRCRYIFTASHSILDLNFEHLLQPNFISFIIIIERTFPNNFWFSKHEKNYKISPPKLQQRLKIHNIQQFQFSICFTFKKKLSKQKHLWPSTLQNSFFFVNFTLELERYLIMNTTSPQLT